MIQNVAAGKCYAAKPKYGRGNDQHRRVVCVDGDTIIYESWGSEADNFRGNLNRTQASLDTFSKSVYKEIECPKGIKLLTEVQDKAKCNCSDKVEE